MSKHAAAVETRRGRTTLLVVAGIATLAVVIVLGYAFFSSVGYSDWGPVPAAAVPAAVSLGVLAVLLVAARVTKLVVMGKVHKRTA